MNAKQSILAVAGLLSLGACSEANPEPAAILPTTAPMAFVINTHGDASVEASREAMDVLTGEAARDVMSPRSSLADAEKGAASALAVEGLSDGGASELRQTVASLMVQRHLKAERPNLAAVGRYTQMLLNDESPNAHLLARSLPALKGTWSEARVSAAAEQGAAEATTYLSETCPGCNATALARSPNEMAQTAAEGASDQQRAIQDGITALRDL